MIGLSKAKDTMIGNEGILVMSTADGGKKE